MNNDNVRFAVGVDVGGSHVCAAVVGLGGEGICSEIVHASVDSRADADSILHVWADVLKRVTGGFDGVVEGIGMAFPGPFDYRNGISLIRGVDKYESLYGMNVGEELKARIGESVDFRFVNDASAFALGECLCGAARDAEKAVALTLGTGVGSGFVDGLRLVEDGDDVPENGWVYCLPFEDGIVDEAFSTRWFCRRWLQISGKEVRGAKEIADVYETDPLARGLFDEYGSRLGAFAGPVMSRFGADMLVLGGNISCAYRLFGPSLEKRLLADGMDVRVRVSSLMDKAAMIGAASLFID